MKDARAVVIRVRGTGLKCDYCKGANWRRKRVRFIVESAAQKPVGNYFLNPYKPVQVVCHDHLRDAVLEVWK